MKIWEGPDFGMTNANLERPRFWDDKCNFEGANISNLDTKIF
jgi:hypothetical protein